MKPRKKSSSRQATSKTIAPKRRGYFKSDLRDMHAAGIEKGQEIANANSAAGWDEFRREISLLSAGEADRELHRLLTLAEIDPSGGREAWSNLAASTDKNIKTRAAIARLALEVLAHVEELRRIMHLSDRERDLALEKHREALSCGETNLVKDFDLIDALRHIMDIGRLFGRIEASLPSLKLARLFYDIREEWRHDASHTHPNLKFDVQIVRHYGKERVEHMTQHRIENLLTEFRQSIWYGRQRTRKAEDRATPHGKFYEPKRGAPKPRKSAAKS